jgi:hypothetical protein
MIFKTDPILQERLNELAKAASNYLGGRKTTLVHDRFQVCHPVEGFISSHQKRDDAFDAAHAWDEKETGYPKGEVEVFDAMARKGQPQTYKMREGSWLLTVKEWRK